MLRVLRPKPGRRSRSRSTLRVWIGSTRRQPYESTEPGDERLPARVAPQRHRAWIVWRAGDQEGSPLLKGAIEKPESLVHSTEPGMHLRKKKRRDVAFLRRLLDLSQNLEGVSSAPRQPVSHAEGSEGIGLARLIEKESCEVDIVPGRKRVTNVQIAKRAGVSETDPPVLAPDTGLRSTRPRAARNPPDESSGRSAPIRHRGHPRAATGTQ